MKTPLIIAAAIMIVLGSLTVPSGFSVAGTVFDNDIEILESDQFGVTLRYSVPDPVFEQLDIDRKELYKMNIPGTAMIRENGRVSIPVKMVPIGLPPLAVPGIKIVGREFYQSPFKKIAPFFSESTEDDFRAAFSSPLAENPKIPSSAPYVVSLDNIRGLNVARIGIPAADYSENPQNLSILKSITLRIDFENARPDISVGFRNPGNSFNKIFRKVIANYDAASEWFMARESESLSLATTSSPFDSAVTWIRMEISSEGVYKFGWLEFRSVDIDPLSIDPDRIRIFNGGGRELPVLNSDPRPQLTEIPLEVMGGSDGQFDNGDYIVFYADAVDGWEYSDILNEFSHYRNHYTSKNVYWIALDGDFADPPKRFTAVDGSPDGSFDLSVDSYTAITHKEVEWIFWRISPTAGIHDVFDWYWDYRKVFTTSIQLFDVVPGGQSKVIIRHRSGTPYLTINSSSPLAPTPVSLFSTYSTADLSSGLNNLQLNSTRDFYLDYISVYYPRWLRLIDGVMRFAQPDTFGVIEYNLTSVPSAFMLLDITDVSNPVKITGGQLNAGDLVFHNQADSSSRKQFYISTLDRMKSPGALALVQHDDLRDISSSNNRADEIIITYDGFYDQAARLAEHRTREYNITVRVVKISDIYNQFSWGLTDAVAIRDFLKYAYENWPAPAPTFALLLGDGHYDYRGNLGNFPYFIPPFENTTYMTDEHFIYFGAEGRLDSDLNGAPDMMIGRIPANSVRDATEMIDKIIAYDSDPDLGMWRNRVVVVADDNITPRGNGETIHTTQAETLSNLHVPRSFDVAKIYLVEYPMRAGFEKPEAREALLGAFNQGSILINYIGHGSPGLWADEHIFRKAEDIPRLLNGKRLPLIFTASCSIGFFDDPTVESFGEDLIRNGRRGAVAVISATRAVYSQPNAAFNYLVFDQILGNDSIGIGEAMYIAKFLRDGPGDPTPTNDRLYVLFGDPSQILQFPKFDIRFTSRPDSLAALSLNSVGGEITDSNGNLMSDFNGTAIITVKDGTINRSVVLRDRQSNPLPGSNNTISFLSPGATIFVGPVDVVNGRFSSQFFVPKDVSYGSQGARIYAYGENGEYDGIGVVDSILISGAIPTVVDSTGPGIVLLADGREFDPGITLVHSGFTLSARVSDEHGVNITGQLGHGIVLKVDNGELYEADATGYFRYNRGEFTGGTMELTMPSLPQGEHEISIKAWDNFNNSTLVTKTIEVVSSENLRLSEVMNYPNPIRSGMASTSFQYCLNNDVDRISIGIFTVSGRKIKTIDISSPDLTQIGCHQIPWNIRDGDGYELANGVYIFKISAYGQNPDGGKAKTEQTKKLAILR